MSSLVTDRLFPAVHPIYARLISAYLASAGFDNAAILNGTGLTREHLTSEHRFLSVEQLSRLIRRTIELTGKPWIGLEIGRATPASAHGPLGYAVVSAPDVRHMLDVLARFAGLRFQTISVSLEEAGTRCVVHLHEHIDLDDIREFVVGSTLAAFFQLIDTAALQASGDIRIQLPWPEQGHSKRIYEQILGMPVAFGSDDLRITLPRSFLDTPCLTADADTHRNALRDCENQSTRHRHGGALGYRVFNRLLECQGRYPSLESVAHELAMSRSTLIRRLGAEGTSYRALLDEVRRELAAWYLLETDTPVERVAENLGYLDATNFSRTFRRWFAQTPRQMRQQAAHREDNLSDLP